MSHVTVPQLLKSAASPKALRANKRSAVAAAATANAAPSIALSRGGAGTRVMIIGAPSPSSPGYESLDGVLSRELQRRRRAPSRWPGQLDDIVWLRCFFSCQSRGRWLLRLGHGSAPFCPGLRYLHCRQLVPPPVRPPTRPRHPDPHQVHPAAHQDVRSQSVMSLSSSFLSVCLVNSSRVSSFCPLQLAGGQWEDHRPQDR